MGLLSVVARVVVASTVLLLLGGVVIVGRQRLREASGNPLARLRRIAPQLTLLAIVLLLNRTFRHLGQDVSWLLGWNLTGTFYTIEGTFVASVQSLATPLLTDALSMAYLYGYVFLVVFPFVIYWVLEDLTVLQKTIVAYAVNYSLGLLLYTLFVSYGPRNYLPELVRPLLYTSHPQIQLLTSAVNANTNVFPSLHTSLSVTVALLARRTREEYPTWYALSVPLAACIVFSTMYLGIHWAIDVVAGTMLAVLSVRVADRYHALTPLAAAFGLDDPKPAPEQAEH